jgi:hypothetical protein
MFLTRQSCFKDWLLMARCDHCQRKAAVQISLPKQGDPVLANFVARVRCRQRRGKPSAALLTNVRDASKVGGERIMRGRWGMFRYCCGRRGMIEDGASSTVTLPKRRNWRLKMAEGATLFALPWLMPRPVSE